MPDTSSITGPSDTMGKNSHYQGFVKSGLSLGRKTNDKLDMIKMKLYNSLNTADIPGSLILWKQANLAKQSDPAIIEVWNHTQNYIMFLRQVLNIYSLDGKGKCVTSSVHVGKHLCNAFWNGYFMIYGDGNLNNYLQPFYRDPMIIYHELTHGLIQYNFPLEYFGESGAINEHVADAFSVIVQHYLDKSPPSEGRWNPGSKIITKRNMSLRTFDDSVAYDYAELGRDDQVKHAKDFYEEEEDFGGVHINSGILNHMFYTFCMELNENIWDKPLKIWFNALMNIRPNCNFEDFASLLAESCNDLYGEEALNILIKALSHVGIV